MSDTPTQGHQKAERSYRSPRQKVPPFARYKGTSVWRKDRKRVREYNRFRASETPAD